MSSPEEAPDDPQLVSHIADAAAWFQHAETIVQQRLYNFLMAASILILAAATSLSASPHPAQKWVVLTVSTVGLLLSAAYGVLGIRQVKFIDLHMDIVESLELKLKNPDYRIITQIARLRAGDEARSPLTNTARKLNTFERIFRSSHFLIASPFAFVVVFAVITGFGLAIPPTPSAVATVGPNPSFEPTATGKPASAAQLKR